MYLPWRGSHGEIHVQRTIETEGSGEGGDNLGDEAVQVGVRGALDVERAAAKIVQSLVVEHDSDIHVLEQRVARQHLLYGSTTALATWGEGQTQKPTFDFLP